MEKIEEVYAYLNENEPEITSNICYASEMLLSELDNALEVLKTRRKQAVENDDDKEYEKLTRYRDTLSTYKENINAFLETSKISQSKKQSHHLSEDFTYKKITAFVFYGKMYSVSDWSNALLTFCNEYAKINKDFPFLLVESPQFKGKKIEYFSCTPTGHRSEKIENTNVYVYSNLSSNAIVKLINDILLFFNENPKEFYIYLDEMYSPKRVKEKQKRN